jgi:hypothetical protein
MLIPVPNHWKGGAMFPTLQGCAKQRDAMTALMLGTGSMHGCLADQTMLMLTRQPVSDLVSKISDAGECDQRLAICEQVNVFAICRPMAPLSDVLMMRVFMTLSVLWC